MVDGIGAGGAVDGRIAEVDGEGGGCDVVGTGGRCDVPLEATRGGIALDASAVWLINAGSELGADRAA